jgi:hypothetical protein
MGRCRTDSPPAGGEASTLHACRNVMEQPARSTTHPGKDVVGLRSALGLGCFTNKKAVVASLFCQQET